MAGRARRIPRRGSPRQLEPNVRLSEPESNGSENGAFLFHSEPLFPALPEAFRWFRDEPNYAAGQSFSQNEILGVTGPSA